MDFSITKFGKKLKKSLYTWDEKTQTLSTNEDNLVLDFSGINRVTFKTGFNCTFNTSHSCVFNTGSGCTFSTGSSCTFNTTGNCIFNTSYNCTFYTGAGCTFDVGFNCTFKTGAGCAFKTSCDCTFDTGGNCVIIRRDVYEVIEILHNTRIKLNSCGIKSYTIIRPERETIKIANQEYYKDKVIERLKGLKPIR